MGTCLSLKQSCFELLDLSRHVEIDLSGLKQVRDFVWSLTCLRHVCDLLKTCRRPGRKPGFKQVLSKIDVMEFGLNRVIRALKVNIEISNCENCWKVATTSNRSIIDSSSKKAELTADDSGQYRTRQSQKTAQHTFVRGHARTSSDHQMMLTGDRLMLGYIMLMVGCVAQLVERLSLAGELTLSCARPAADGWPCG